MFRLQEEARNFISNSSHRGSDLGKLVGGVISQAGTYKMRIIGRDKWKDAFVFLDVETGNIFRQSFQEARWVEWLESVQREQLLSVTLTASVGVATIQHEHGKLIVRDKCGKDLFSSYSYKEVYSHCRLRGVKLSKLSITYVEEV